MAPVLEARELRFSYTDTAVIDGLSLRIEAGELVGLIGSNGSGKTTLLRLLMRLLAPDQGEVWIEGEALRHCSRREIARKVSLVPQDASMAFSLTVSEVVAMGRNPHRGRFEPESREDLRIVAKALEATSLTALSQRSVDTLSGGERQRVLIARAIAQQTPVFLLDEPTANLDLRHQLEVLELVRTLTETGVCGVAALHDLSLASRFCTRLMLLAHGTVVASGPPAEVLTVENLARYLGIRAHVEEDGISGGLTIVPIAPLV